MNAESIREGVGNGDSQDATEDHNSGMCPGMKANHQAKGCDYGRRQAEGYTGLQRVSHVSVSLCPTPRVRGGRLLAVPYTRLLAAILFYHASANCVCHIVIVCFAVLMMTHL